TIRSLSARITANGHTLARGPSSTSPHTNASGWMNAVGSIDMNRCCAFRQDEQDEQDEKQTPCSWCSSCSSCSSCQQLEGQSEREVHVHGRGRDVALAERHRGAEAEAVRDVVAERRVESQ